MRSVGISKIVLLLTVAAVSTGCSVYRWVGMRAVYDVHKFPEQTVYRDLVYRHDNESNERHRLDLFLPPNDGFRTLLFVHGGGWTKGDKDLRVSGVDVYGNIGRFYASRGLGVAVMSYRLQPDVEWPAQVEDVRSALGWLADNLADYGGEPEAIFLAGHSAGAHLASHAALSKPAPPAALCGVVAVSGAGYDLEVDALEEDVEYYEERLRTGPDDTEWRVAGSVLPLVSETAVPFLVLYAEGEWPALHDQSRALFAALQEFGSQSRLVEVPGENHERMVLALSHPKRTAGPAVLDFVNTLECGSERGDSGKELIH